MGSSKAVSWDKYVYDQRVDLLPYILSEIVFYPEDIGPIKEASLLLNILLYIDKIRHRHENILKKSGEKRDIIYDNSTIDKKF